MIKITNISADAHQKTTVLLADNTSVVITLDFLPATQRWVVGLSRDTFEVKSIGLCVHPNLLRSYRQVIPFGLSCVASDGVDPFDINDFENGRIELYVLDNTNGESNVVDIETQMYDI